MKILRAADYRVMPWKNGLGSTTEVAISPAGAETSDFDWRVSMAQVARDGPFSCFPDIDRTLLILEGNGITLSVAGDDDIALDRSAIHTFPGDRPTSAKLIDGPIVDLNVMSRRNRVSHHVRRINIMAPQAFSTSRDMLLFVEAGIVTATSGASVETLRHHDTLWLDASSAITTIESVSHARIVVIEFGR